MSKYLFTSDPGHGWLHVRRAELRRLGVEDKISGYSYQRGDMVYLEEDCDLISFIEAKKQFGEAVEFDMQYVETTPIRGYARYRTENAD